MDKPAVRDGSLLLFRFVLGIIFVAHGFDKFFVQGLTATGQQFAAWGVPQAQLSAYLAATAEFVGGIIFDGWLVDHDCCGNIGVADGGGVLFGAHECRVFHRWWGV